MKWRKYAEMVASDPVKIACLTELVGPVVGWDGTHSEFTRQSWVERQLKYVAVRPWENLKLGSGDMRVKNAEARYSVFYHIGNVESMCARMRFLPERADGSGISRSIHSAMHDIVKWFGVYWAEQEGCSLVFDAVVRNARGVVPNKKYPEQTINIWIPPAGFMPSTTS